MGNKKVGRPKTDIDKETFEKLCGMQCTLEEIAGFFNCSDDTINNWCKKTYGDNFSGVYKKKNAPGLISLRRTQFKLAEKNASMAIFLGKQYLGQKDVIETDNTHEINKVEELLSRIEKEAKNDNK